MRSIDRTEPLVVWWGSLVECRSALERQARLAQLDSRRKRQAEDLLQQLSAAWTEIEPSESLRHRALRLLAHHSLSAADALQLAAAQVWIGDQPRGRAFVCLDSRLRDAAEREGFTVQPVEFT